MTTSRQSVRRVPVEVGFAIVSALLFGLSTPGAKLLLGEIPPLLLAGLLYAGSGLGLSVVRLLAPASADEARITRADVPWLAGAVVAGGIFAPVLLMKSIKFELPHLSDNDVGGILMGDVEAASKSANRSRVTRSKAVRRLTPQRRAVRGRRTLANRKAKLSATRATKRRAVKMKFAGSTIYVAKARSKARRHVTAPATASQIAKTLGLTQNDLASARALIDRLGL